MKPRQRRRRNAKNRERALKRRLLPAVREASAMFEDAVRALDRADAKAAALVGRLEGR